MNLSKTFRYRWISAVESIEAAVFATAGCADPSPSDVIRIAGPEGRRPPTVEPPERKSAEETKDHRHGLCSRCRHQEYSCFPRRPSPGPENLVLPEF